MKIVRERLSYANVVATAALFIALGLGSAYAAEKIGSKDIAKNAVKAKHIKKKQVKSKHIKNRNVKTQDLAEGAVNSDKVADGSLLGADFAPNQLPEGGPGPQGPQGPQGEQGSPDTGPQILSKLAPVDGSDSGLDADQVDGTNLITLDVPYSGSGETDLVSGGGLDLNVRCDSTPRLMAQTAANGASFFSTATPTDAADTVFTAGLGDWSTSSTLTPLNDGLGGGDDADESLIEIQYRAANGTLATASFSMQRTGANCRASGVLMVG